jgi:hypothetical protein
MSRLIAAVGALGVLATAWVAVDGYRIEGGAEALVRHAAGGLVASLLVLFAQAWFAIFLAGSLRVPGAGLRLRQPEVERRRLRRTALAVVVSASLAVGVTMAAFGSGLLAYAREVAQASHAVTALAALATQVVALAMGLRGVAQAERALVTVEATWVSARPEQSGDGA